MLEYILLIMSVIPVHFAYLLLWSVFKYSIAGNFGEH